MRRVRGVGCFRSSKGLGLSAEGGKGQVTGVLGGQRVAASHHAESETRCGEEIRRVLVGLRIGETGGREVLWHSRIGPSVSLTAGVTRGARERVCERCSGGRKTCSLAGHMGVCSHPKSRVSRILRATLRGCLRPVLRGI